MREPNYFDFLTIYHYVIVVIFIAIVIGEIYYIKRSIAKKKIILTGFIIVMTLITLAMGRALRVGLFPGGGLHDTRYGSDLAYVRIFQGYIESYKEACKSYPTTEQGFKALVEKPDGVDCPNYEPPMRKVIDDLKYVSDGRTYEIESTRNYRIPGLFIRGANGTSAKLYIREVGIK